MTPKALYLPRLWLEPHSPTEVDQNITNIRVFQHILRFTVHSKWLHPSPQMGVVRLQKKPKSHYEANIDIAERFLRKVPFFFYNYGHPLFLRLASSDRPKFLAFSKKKKKKG